MEPVSLSCWQYVALEHGTCLHSCWVGDISLHYHFAFMGLGNLFWPLSYSLPRHHDLRFLNVKYCQIHCRAVDMFKRSWPLQFQPSSDSHLILIHKHYVPLSRIDDVGKNMALLRRGHFLSTSAHYLGIWSKDSLSSTLEPTCLNGRFFAFVARLSSLAFDRVTLRVFDASSLFTFCRLYL